jgi:hypothetical protein
LSALLRGARGLRVLNLGEVVLRPVAHVRDWVLAISGRVVLFRSLEILQTKLVHACGRQFRLRRMRAWSGTPPGCAHVWETPVGVELDDLSVWLRTETN